MRALAMVMLVGAVVMAQAGPTIDEVTRSALANRIESGRAVGVEIGVATAEGRTFASHGAIAKGSSAPTKDTVFEIGSITKVFTALLLADMIERHEVGIDDPVSKYLPTSVTVPSRNGRTITLADLVTHTAGLPRVPSNIDATSLDNPYATYDAGKLYAFLSGYQLTRDPGSQWEYSNLGGGLLGHVLARGAGLSYEQLVKERILGPLGMRNTSITLTVDMRARLATPHDEALHPVSLWDFDALAGAGALRSTADDLLTFAAANAGLIDTPLRAAMVRMRGFRRPGQGPLEQAMGWLVLKPLGSEVFLHDGGTHGFRSAIAIDPARGRAAVAWTNAPVDVTDLATHLIDARSPLPMLSLPRTAIRVDPNALESYVGVYDLAPTFSITITRDGDRLFEQATNQGRLEILAEKQDEFFLRALDAQISFERDASGKVVALVLHQNGRDVRAPRR